MTETHTASQLLSELDELMHARMAARPLEGGKASLAAIKSDPANGDLFRRLVLVEGREDRWVPCASQQRRSPDTHVTSKSQRKDTPMPTIDPAKALAEARKLWMAEHDATGLKGIKRADAALRVTEPWLYAAYAKKLNEQVKK